MEYTYNDHAISLDEGHLIKPEDLPKHIGEVLTFHNGRGYIVTGKLTEVEMLEYDEYDYGARYQHIEYDDELDMGWYAEPENELEEYETLMFAHTIKILDIHNDEISLINNFRTASERKRMGKVFTNN